MRTIRVKAVRAALCLFSVCVAHPASAQTRPREPRRSMMLTYSLFGAGADDPDTGAAIDPRQASGMHTDSDAMLVYGLRDGHTSLQVSARSVLRYDASRRSLDTVRDQGAVELSTGGRRTRFHAGASASYSPLYQFGAASEAQASPLSETVLAHGDFANARLASRGSAANLDLTHAIGRRSTLSFSCGIRHTAFNDADLNSTGQEAGVRFTRGLTRRASLRLGYGYHAGRSTLVQSAPTRGHDLDLGVDYSRALSFSRHTTLGFSSGSSALTEAQRTRYVITGSATITRAIGRSWSARVIARRGLQLLEGIAGPVLSDSVTTTLGGAVSRRVSFSSSAAVSSGDLGVRSGDRRYGSMSGAAGVGVAITRRLMFEGQYFYYRHRFGDGVRLAPGLANNANRQGLRAGVTWRTPLFR